MKHGKQRATNAKNKIRRIAKFKLSWRKKLLTIRGTGVAQLVYGSALTRAKSGDTKASTNLNTKGS